MVINGEAPIGGVSFVNDRPPPPRRRVSLLGEIVIHSFEQPNPSVDFWDAFFSLYRFLGRIYSVLPPTCLPLHRIVYDYIFESDNFLLPVCDFQCRTHFSSRYFRGKYDLVFTCAGIVHFLFYSKNLFRHSRIAYKSDVNYISLQVTKVFVYGMVSGKRKRKSGNIRMLDSFSGDYCVLRCVHL